jgi:cytochrome c oxidase subunit 2
MWNFPLFPEQASSIAGPVDAVFLYELGILLFFTLFICLLILGFAIRYRRGAKVNRVNPPRSSHVIEALWISIPLLIALTMYVVGTVVFFDQYEAPGDATDISVVGKQWMWYLQHPEGKREINELHVALGRPVRLKMISQDVIHSFYVPAFRIKQDVLPGRYTTAWFNPTKIGKYHLFCAEYCGTNHSLMGGTVHVMDPAEYDRWLAGDDAGLSMAKQGEELFVRHHCAGCHGPSQTVRAPRLEGVYGRPVPVSDEGSKDIRFVKADDRYVRDSILLPKAQVVAGYEPLMPSFAGQIGEEDLLKIIAYIKSIGPKGSDR